MGALAAKRSVRGHGPEPAEIGGAADDEDILGALAAAPEGNLTVRLVRRDDDVGEAKRLSLGTKRQPVEQPRASTEPRLEQLRDEIVMVEDEGRPALP